MENEEWRIENGEITREGQERKRRGKEEVEERKRKRSGNEKTVHIVLPSATSMLCTIKFKAVPNY